MPSLERQALAAVVERPAEHLVPHELNVTRIFSLDKPTQVLLHNETPCSKASHSADRGHTVHPDVTQCSQRSHSAARRHTVRPDVTQCIQTSFGASRGHTVHPEVTPQFNPRLSPQGRTERKDFKPSPGSPPMLTPVPTVPSSASTCTTMVPRALMPHALRLRA